VRFEWDAAKNESNLAKHGVDFPFAVAIFSGPIKTTPVPKRAHFKELRYITFGKINNVVYVVVWSPREKGSVIRMISARKANEREARRCGL
jgi:uncharacterized protein